jgi:hypothetical protein
MFCPHSTCQTCVAHRLAGCCLLPALTAGSCHCCRLPYGTTHTSVGRKYICGLHIQHHLVSSSRNGFGGAEPSSEILLLMTAHVTTSPAMKLTSPKAVHT